LVVYIIYSGNVVEKMMFERAKIRIEILTDYVLANNEVQTRHIGLNIANFQTL